MKCINPLKAGFNSNGDIVYSSKKMSLELDSFEFECRKCLPCRLNMAQEKAIRCVHEAQCHEDNIFITLTYNDENLKSPKLNYLDFQLFMKRLRNRRENGVKDKELRKKLKVSYMVTGEYGEKTKRPHWHAIIFNYRPHDSVYHYTTDLGERVFKSDYLSETWGKGFVEYGSVTFESAGYVARYAAKKLVHGNDQDHDYHPIHKTSSSRAIGRSWIEKYWKQTFERGFVLTPSRSKIKIPRYYVDWLKKYRWDDYVVYVNGPRQKAIENAVKKQRKEEVEFLSNISNYKGGKAYPRTRPQVELQILERKFSDLQKELKIC